MLTTLLFDLDDTLYTLDRHRREHLRRAWSEWLDTLDAQRQHAVLAAAVAERIFFRDMDDFLQRQGAADTALRAQLCQRSQATWFTDLEFDAGVVPLLDRCAAQYRLGLITNGPSWTQQAKITQLQLERWFDVMVVSEEVGVEKPNPEIFQVALQRLNVNVGECVMIGDNPSADMRGAEAVGMRGIWINTGVFPYATDIAPPWLTVPHVTALAPHIERWACMHTD
jgi:putative hydrolase of the HAD superfamily